MGPQKSRGLYRLQARWSNQPADAGIPCSLNNYGLFGATQHSVNPSRLFGAVLLVGGVILILW
jgi:hypothetical protein